MGKDDVLSKLRTDEVLAELDATRAREAAEAAIRKKLRTDEVLAELDAKFKR